MFCDLVGSTALSARLDPEDAQAFRMIAISGLFADAIAGLATSPAAPKLLAVINQQIAQAGLVIVPTARN
jgi:hypothetical protein